MHRWLALLLVAGALLLIASAIGDVFLIHHHLNLEEHFSVSTTAFLFNNLRTLPDSVLGGISSIILGLGFLGVFSAITRHFCGWHNSAYLEVNPIN